MNRVVNKLYCVQWAFGMALAMGLLSLSGSAEAQAVPDSVATDVTTTEEEATGEAEFSEAPAVKEEPPPPPTCPCPEEPPPEDPDALKTAWTLSAGGALNTGNTESWIVNAGTDFKLEKKDHTLTANALFNFGRANIPNDAPDAGYQTTVKQFLGNIRYDYFFTDMDAVWIAIAERWDPLAGFDTQLRLEAGYLRAFIKEDDHYFAGRVGYSLTYENYSSLAMVTGDQTIHGLLAALDYENKVNENITLLSGITTIFNLNELNPGSIGAFEDVRVYFFVGMVAKLMEKLSIETRFNLLYDRVPAAAKKVDTSTTLSLIYTLI